MRLLPNGTKTECVSMIYKRHERVPAFSRFDVIGGVYIAIFRHAESLYLREFTQEFNLRHVEI